MAGLRLAARPAATAIIGFDSAWTDSARNPGAACALCFDRAGGLRFAEPRLVRFEGALDFIGRLAEAYPLCLVALDQPTIVPNPTGCRPVDRVAGALISYIGGGVQPANRGKRGMFDDMAPIWRFKAALGAIEDPEAAREAEAGRFLIEVFPALALAGLRPEFGSRLGAPRYNPANRRRFREADWRGVVATVADVATALGLPDLAGWAEERAAFPRPVKADQDRLDATICALVGLIWRGCDRSASATIGDLASGYMIAPVSTETRARLSAAAARRAVPFA